MRTLTSTLSTAQKQEAGLKALVKIVLTQGANEYTYTKTRILAILKHREEPYSQKATVLLDNADGSLSDLDLKGYKGVISYGATTSAGDEYSAAPPLYVIPQQFNSAPGLKVCVLDLKGIPDLLDDDRASGRYIPGLTDTVKDIINGILAATISAYSHCTAYTVNWDSEDSLIDVYGPQQNMILSTNTSRLEAVLQLLSYTKCMIRFEADGQAHIFVPKISGDTWVVNTAYLVHDYVQPSTPNNNFTYECTTAGTSHATTEPTWPTTAGGTVSDGTVTWTARAPDYEYRLKVTGYHTFFSKAYRNRLVIPNYVTVSSFVGDSPSYTGYATDPSYSLIRKDAFADGRFTSNAQCTSIAKSMIARAQIAAEGGSALVPLNVGAEVFDWVKVVDSRQGDTRLGTIGYIERTVDFRKNEWKMSFGFGGWLHKQGVSRSLVGTVLGSELGNAAVTNPMTSIVTNVGDTLLHSNDATVSTTSGTYVKKKEVLINSWGYLRIKFTLDQTDAGETLDVYGRIYKNGAAIGTERIRSLFGTETFSEDFDQIKPGDLLQLYIHSEGGQNQQALNFRFYWDDTGQANPSTPLYVNTLT